MVITAIVPIGMGGVGSSRSIGSGLLAMIAAPAVTIVASKVTIMTIFVMLIVIPSCQ